MRIYNCELASIGLFHRYNCMSLKGTRPPRIAYATLTCGMPLPRAPGIRYWRIAPQIKPPAVGIRIVHQIHVLPVAVKARSINLLSAQMMDR
jgi:hypothetical protein